MGVDKFWGLTKQGLQLVSSKYNLETSGPDLCTSYFSQLAGTAPQQTILS